MSEVETPVVAAVVADEPAAPEAEAPVAVADSEPATGDKRKAEDEPEAGETAAPAEEVAEVAAVEEPKAKVSHPLASARGCIG